MCKVIYSENSLVDPQLEPHMRTSRPGSNRQGIPVKPSLLAGIPPCVFNPHSRGLKPPVVF
jgi:hypothetical protein